MAKIYNSDLSKELADGAKIQVSFDDVPNQLAEKVVPVMEVNPKMLRRQNVATGAVKTASGSQLIYTTSSTSDFFLTGLTIGYSKNAACDVASGAVAITCTQDGASKIIGYLPIQTLTAQYDSIAIIFKEPMKLDRASQILSNNTYTAGEMMRTFTIYGYNVDNVNA